MSQRTTAPLRSSSSPGSCLPENSTTMRYPFSYCYLTAILTPLPTCFTCILDQSPRVVGVAERGVGQPYLQRCQLAALVQTLVRLAPGHRRYPDLASQSTPRPRDRLMRLRNLILTSCQADVLRMECNLAGPQEGASQLLCGSSLLDVDPWRTDRHDSPDMRLTVHSVEPLPLDRVRRGHTSVSWDMDCYVALLRKAREQGLHPAICHSHPNSAAPFSSQDDENEGHLRDVLRRRNRNSGQMLTSILLRGDGQIQARVWGPSGPPQPISVRILGRTFSEFCAPAIASHIRADGGVLAATGPVGR